MKRKFLEDLGLEKETIDKILDENSSDIGKAKGELESVQSQLNDAKAELKTAQDTIAERDKQLDKLKAESGDNEELKKQIETLQNENKAKDEEMKKELTKIRREGIDELLLSEAGAKNSKAAKALLEEIEADDDEKYKSARLEQIKSLAKAEDTKFLFGSKKLSGTEPGEPEGDPDSKPDFSKMTYSEIAAYMSENPGTELK